MSLKDTIQNAAASAFNVVDSLQQTVTLKTVSGEAYDATTMVNTPTYVNTEVSALVVTYSAREVDGLSILATDRKVILLHPLFELITPADKIVIDSLEYDIVHVMRDPADATWSLQVRR